MSVTIHIERTSGDWDALYTKVTAWCGEECLIGPDAVPIPEDFDFVLPKDAHLSDCPGCLYEFTAQGVKAITRFKVPA